MLFSQTVWSFWTCTGEGVINLGLTIIWIWLAFASSKIRWIYGYMPALFNISQAVTSCNSLLQALSTAAPPRTTASNRWLWSFYLLSMFFFFEILHLATKVHIQYHFYLFIYYIYISISLALLHCWTCFVTQLFLFNLTRSCVKENSDWIKSTSDKGQRSHIMAQ